jgi:hypothetical protein
VGWGDFAHVFPGGDGILCAVNSDGALLWYRDGSGWDFFTHLFAGDVGVIFAYRADEFGGTIHRYRDLVMDGTNGAAGGGWLTSEATVHNKCAGCGIEPRNGYVAGAAKGGWQISGIEGYCWPLSVGGGETVRFHVSATTPGVSTVSYVRLGGRGPRLGVHVEAGVDFEAVFHAAGTWSTDCAWPVAFELSLPLIGPWEPGFYAARVQGPSGPPFDIPFVVRRGPVSAPLAFLVNVNTWNAYNTWGGASNYTHTASPIDLTLKRPNHHLLTYWRDHPNGNHMLRSEIWLHGWLKAQGYQVDLYTDVDLDGASTN